MTTDRFRETIWKYYGSNKREMPWRKTKDPYRILVSEIMLQQTQASRVMKFYSNFIEQFPDFRTLARAKTASVLRAWAGLGYNRRALNLQRLSRIVLEKFNGHLPRDRETLESLPGIGEGTSGAIRAFAFNEPEVFIETNIRRVFIHFFFPHKQKVTDEELKRYIQRTLDSKNPREWYWALMDYGSAVPGFGTSAAKMANPNQKSAHYKRQAPFQGSDRELRGKILHFLLKKKVLSPSLLSRATKEPIKRVKKIAEILVKEGFVKKKGTLLSISG